MKNKKNISDLELLDSQIYKAPIWLTIFVSWKVFLTKIFIAWLFSFVIDTFDMFIGYSFFVSYFAVEVVYFNWINNENFKP